MARGAIRLSRPGLTDTHTPDGCPAPSHLTMRIDSEASLPKISDFFYIVNTSQPWAEGTSYRCGLPSVCLGLGCITPIGTDGDRPHHIGD